jgi:nucleoside phosphorylase
LTDRNTATAVTGGTVPLGSAAYIDRPFEATIFERLTAGQWVLLLGARQCGKSSALVRLYVRLEEEGYTCVLIDLQRYARGDEAYHNFLGWIADRIASAVGCEYAEPPDRRRDDLQSWLEATLPEEFANVAILIDETSGVPEAFRERFFGQLRALYNDAAASPATAVSNRVVFLFAGTFRPETMITSDNSPFNVSVWTPPEDFDDVAAAQLGERVLGAGGDVYGRKAYASVRGQPYMLQVLLGAVERAIRSGDDPDDAFENAIQSFRDGVDRHVSDLMRLVSSDAALCTLATKLLDEPIPYIGTNVDHMYAVVSGMAVVEEGHLVIHNELYRDSLASLAADNAEETDGGLVASFDVVLVTANDIETAAVRDVFTGEHPTVHRRNNTYRDLGIYGRARVALVRAPEMGAAGAGGMIMTVTEAIRDLTPQTVILVGVAFGMDPEEQEIGDVLCATRIIDYEMQRVGTSDGGREIRLRGAAVPTTARVLGRMHNAASETASRVIFGVVASGDKLVDNLAMREELRELAPDAVGGEMEGRGAYAAATPANVDWIVVKAICDWADGNKGEDKEMRQKLAATQAAQFVRFTLELGGFDSR